MARVSAHRIGRELAALEDTLPEARDPRLVADHRAALGQDQQENRVGSEVEDTDPARSLLSALAIAVSCC